VLVVGGFLLGIGQQNHDHIGLSGRFGESRHPQAGLFGLALGGRTFT
jgi:hypothetical protein